MIFKSGYSNRIEDADIIIIEDYWSPGRIIDTYYEALSPKDMKYIENLPNTIASGAVDSMGNYDERYSLVQAHMQNEEFELNNDDISASSILLEYPDLNILTLIGFNLVKTGSPPTISH